MALVEARSERLELITHTYRHGHNWMEPTTCLMRHRDAAAVAFCKVLNLPSEVV